MFGEALTHETPWASMYCFVSLGPRPSGGQGWLCSPGLLLWGRGEEMRLHVAPGWLAGHWGTMPAPVEIGIVACSYRVPPLGGGCHLLWT